MVQRKYHRRSHTRHHNISDKYYALKYFTTYMVKGTVICCILYYDALDILHVQWIPKSRTCWWQILAVVSLHGFTPTIWHRRKSLTSTCLILLLWLLWMDSCRTYHFTLFFFETCFICIKYHTIIKQEFCRDFYLKISRAEFFSSGFSIDTTM